MPDNNKSSIGARAIVELMAVEIQSSFGAIAQDRSNFGALSVGEIAGRLKISEAEPSVLSWNNAVQAKSGDARSQMVRLISHAGQDTLVQIMEERPAAVARLEGIFKADPQSVVSYFGAVVDAVSGSGTSGASQPQGGKPAPQAIPAAGEVGEAFVEALESLSGGGSGGSGGSGGGGGAGGFFAAVGAAIGFAIGGPVGAVVGGVAGATVDKRMQEDARGERVDDGRDEDEDE
jgi:hypothetical protein